MTCFMRHLKGLFEDRGIEQTPENKRKMQRELREITGVESKKCWDIWKSVKPWVADDEKKKILDEKLRGAFRV